MIYAVQIFMAFLGSLGFAMLYNIKGIKLLYAAAGGLLGWSINLSLGIWLNNEVAQFFIAAVLVTIYAEICARLNKTPTTTFLITAIIPLVPGGALYYTMSYAVNGLWNSFVDSGVYTVSLAVALAAGIMVGSSLIKIWLTVIDYLEIKKSLALSITTENPSTTRNKERRGG